MTDAPLFDRYVAAEDRANIARTKYLITKAAWYEAEAEYAQAKEDRNAAATSRSTAYSRYADACRDESCEAHTFDMWTVHGEPEGPLG